MKWFSWLVDWLSSVFGSYGWPGGQGRLPNPGHGQGGAVRPGEWGGGYQGQTLLISFTANLVGVCELIFFVF